MPSNKKRVGAQVHKKGKALEKASSKARSAARASKPGSQADKYVGMISSGKAGKAAAARAKKQDVEHSDKRTAATTLMKALSKFKSTNRVNTSSSNKHRN